MSTLHQSSRRRYGEYRRHLQRLRKKDPQAVAIAEQEQNDAELRGPEHRPIREHRRRAERGGRVRSFMDLLRALLGFTSGHRSTMVMSLVALTVASLLALVPPYGTKPVIDSVLGDEPVPVWFADLLGPLAASKGSLLWTVCVGMIVASLLQVGISIWARWQMTKLSKLLTVRVRRKVFEHAVRLPLHRIYEIKSGGMSSVLRDDAGAAGELTFSLLYNPWRAITQLLGALAVLAWVDWRLLVGAMLVLPLIFYTERLWVARIRPLFGDVRATRRHVDSQATESFGGIRVVRGFSRSRSESGSFVRNNDLMARQELYAWWWMRGIDAAWQVIIPVSTALLLLYGGWRILADRAGNVPADQALTVGSLVMFMAYLGSLLGPLAVLASTATGLQNALAGLDRTLDILDEPVEMPDREGAVDVSAGNVGGRIVVRGVSFQYPETDEPVLRGIDLDAPGGTTVALVGPSGAGKTTLCNLIARFYDPTQGRIELDGRDLRDIRLESFRSLLGIVEQETFLFDGTVRENIAYGRRDAPEGEVFDAARRANAHGFITGLPDGYDTLIGERGVKLSGGQRQRVSIARAILADPKILILDEATSNLDSESEQLIQAALSDLFANRTTFVIAHRLSTVQHADQILVIEGGRVVERGTHAELMAVGGSYMVMVQRQQTFSSEEAGIGEAVGV